MPKALLDYLGYVIYFWINEGIPLEPVHVHVAKGKPTPSATKIWLTKEGCKLEHNNSEIPPKDLKALLEFINENKYYINRGRMTCHKQQERQSSEYTTSEETGANQTLPLKTMSWAADSLFTIYGAKLKRQTNHLTMAL